MKELYYFLTNEQLWIVNILLCTSLFLLTIHLSRYLIQFLIHLKFFHF